MNWLLFGVLSILFIVCLTNVDWDPPKRRRKYDVDLVELWMYEDDLEELDE